MARPLLPDDLWEVIRPLLPPHPPSPKGGRPRLDDRAALTGIIFVLKTGIPWEDLPQEMGCGSGMTCWRRLAEWQDAGVWWDVVRVLLSRLRHADRIDFSRFIVDSSHVRAYGGGTATGPSPVDRRKKGSKQHFIVDGGGVPLAVVVTAANRNDTETTLDLVDLVPPMAGRVGHPRQRPERLQGDRGYDDEGDRAALRRRGIEPLLAKRRTPPGSGLGVFRWVVERSISWFHQYRRLRTRYERRDELHHAFCMLAAALIIVKVFM
ncbi:MAG TPA: IS5 family transposase [Gemmataceae bacterium]|nr:IS5 family transposase [Gemmataceae bacterium]